MAEQKTERGWMDWITSPWQSFKSWGAEKISGMVGGSSNPAAAGLLNSFNGSTGSGEAPAKKPEEESPGLLGGLMGGIGKFFSSGWGKMLMIGALLLGAFKMIFGGDDEEEKKKEAEVVRQREKKEEEPGIISKGLSGLGAGLTAAFTTAVGKMFGMESLGGVFENAATAATVGYANNSVLGAGVGTVLVKGLTAQLLSSAGVDANKTYLDEIAVAAGGLLLNSFTGNKKAAPSLGLGSLVPG